MSTEDFSRERKRDTTPYSKPKFRLTYVSCPYPVSEVDPVSDLLWTDWFHFKLNNSIHRICQCFKQRTDHFVWSYFL